MKQLFFLVLLGLLFPKHTLQAQSKAYKKEIKQHRKSYKANFLKNENGPLDKKEVKTLRFFKPDPDAKVLAQFQKLEGEEPFEMATVTGATQPYIKYGILKFKYKGQVTELILYRNLRYARMPGFRDLLFLPFKDRTNGGETYGGGRYLNLKTSDIKDGKVVVDFNKSYNPYCVYKEGYICPIPPVENHLAITIQAGEKLPKGK